MGSTPITVAGNSHVVHYKRAIDMGAVPAPRRPVTFHAQLALSLLHPFFADPLATEKGRPCVLFVPGFRIGNRVLAEPDHPEAHNAVVPELVSPENDRRMLDLYTDRLDALRRQNPAIRFAFWSLAVSEHRAQRAGRYVREDGTFRHPTWNLVDIEDEFAEHTIPLTPMMESPLLPAMFKDSSGHPTEVADAFFDAIIEDPDGPTDSLLRQLRRFATVPRFNFWHPVTLTGDSVWLTVLADYVERGNVRLNSNVRLVLDSTELTGGTSHGTDLVYVTDADVAALDEDGNLDHPAIDEIRRLAALGYTPRVFPWASKANEHTNPPVILDADHPGAPMNIDDRLTELLDGVANVHRDAHWAPKSINLRDVDIEKERGRPKPTLDGLTQVIRIVGGGRALERFGA